MHISDAQLRLEKVSSRIIVLCYHADCVSQVCELAQMPLQDKIKMATKYQSKFFAPRLVEVYSSFCFIKFMNEALALWEELGTLARRRERAFHRYVEFEQGIVRDRCVIGI